MGQAQYVSRGCDQYPISMVLSPNDKWVAFAQEEICADGGFVTTIANVVQIARRGEEPAKQNVVFSIDNGGHPRNRPLIRWLSPERLQITVPNKSLYKIHKGSFDGVDLVIQHEPDDPAERERWLKGLGLTSR
jgi:hypothetical protein